MKRALVNVFALLLASSAANAIECNYRQPPFTPELMQALSEVSKETPFGRL